MRTRLILPALTLLVFTLASVARAQTTPANPAPAAPPAPVAAKPEEKATPPASTPPAVPDASAVTIKNSDPVEPSAARTPTKDTLSVDFPEEEISNILRNIADLFELNLVIPPSLQGRTSIKLRDVTWRQIFQVVLSPVGYTFVEDGNIVKIVSQDTLQQEPTATEIFVLSYSRASDMLPTLNALVDATKGGKIVVDGRSNSLVITERPSQLNRVRTVIEQLDKATEQVMIETKFIEVTNRDVKNLGVNWASLQNYQASLSGLTQSVRASSVPNAFYNLVNHPADPTNGGVTAVFSASDFNLILSALQTLNNTKVVSNPTIVTLNNTEATINVGEEDPVPRYGYNEQKGSFEVNGFDYKPIGVILKVTPQVNARGFIKLILAPEVSQKNGTTSFGGAGGAEIPIIATRKATTQVSLKDGYTMGIGGLLTSSNINGSNKVPVLGSIPLLGGLFKTKSHDVTTTNLIIFITARTVSADGAPVEQVFDPKLLQQMDIKPNDLPGAHQMPGSSSPAPAVKGKEQNPLRPFKS